MIAFVRGIIEDISEDNVVLDVQGVGYNIKISSGTLSELPKIGEEIKLYTYTCVREDAFLLYGFLSRDELDIFRKLITVNGIGPKGGLAILSVMTADDLRFAILSGDVKMIATAPGIGKKTAERVVLDLRDKVSLEDTMVHHKIHQQGAGSHIENSSAKGEAVEALTALGYSAQEALNVVKHIEITEGMDVEEILKLALKNMF